ncbi:MAG: DUF1700 domain-containing protein [Lachnospiraceae bacterium]|nr:DUF1700 domain-containing protein [Lachnospiraceae bacterium]
MNREEFLKKLESLLSDIDASERKEALEYYEEYFEDSEKEEADVIRELGSPQEVAHSIREELAEKEIVVAAEGREESQSEKSQSEAGQFRKESSQGSKGMEPWAVVLIVLAVLFLGIPVGVPLLAGAFSLVAGVIAVILGLILAAAICAVGFGFAAIVCLVVSIVKLVTIPLAGIILMGIGLLLMGLCFLSALITWKVCAVIVPAIVRGIVYLCRLPFHGRKGAAA